MLLGMGANTTLNDSICYFYGGRGPGKRQRPGEARACSGLQGAPEARPLDRGEGRRRGVWEMVLGQIVT